MRFHGGPARNRDQSPSIESSNSRRSWPRSEEAKCPEEVYYACQEYYTYKFIQLYDRFLIRIPI